MSGTNAMESVAEGLLNTGMRAIRRSCSDCAHVIKPREQWCMAPQLAEVLDTSDGHRNEMTPCEGVRDFKHACGHSARWFEPRVKE